MTWSYDISIVISQRYYRTLVKAVTSASFLDSLLCDNEKVSSMCWRKAGNGPRAVDGNHLYVQTHTSTLQPFTYCYVNQWHVSHWNLLQDQVWHPLDAKRCQYQSQLSPQIHLVHTQTSARARDGLVTILGFVEIRKPCGCIQECILKKWISHQHTVWTTVVAEAAIAVTSNIIQCSNGSLYLLGCTLQILDTIQTRPNCSTLKPGKCCYTVCRVEMGSYTTREVH